MSRRERLLAAEAYRSRTVVPRARQLIQPPRDGRERGYARRCSISAEKLSASQFADHVGFRSGGRLPETTKMHFSSGCLAPILTNEGLRTIYIRAVGSGDRQTRCGRGSRPDNRAEPQLGESLMGAVSVGTPRASKCNGSRVLIAKAPVATNRHLSETDRGLSSILVKRGKFRSRRGNRAIRAGCGRFFPGRGAQPAGQWRILNACLRYPRSIGSWQQSETWASSIAPKEKLVVSAISGARGYACAASARPSSARQVMNWGGC